MRIEFWLDFLCPLSYLTHKNLVEALEELNIKKYDLLYRSYQLKEHCDEANLMEVLFENKTDEEIKEAKELLNEIFPNYENLNYQNTDLAHHLAHLAKRNNVAQECNTEILKAFFEKGLKIDDIDVLLDIAEKVGMSRFDAKQALETRCFVDQIESNKENAQSRGIVRIPHLRVNMKNNFPSYLTKDEIKDIINNLSNQKKKTEICGEMCDF